MRRVPFLDLLSANPRRDLRVWAGFSVVIVVACPQADSGSPGNRCVAVLTAALSGMIGGVLFGKRSGVWLGILLGIFHNGFREQYGPAPETLLSVLPAYMIVVGGIAWLSATALDLLKDSRESLSELERQLVTSDRTQHVFQLISRVGEMIANAWRRERQTEQLIAALQTREQAIRQQVALTEGTQLLLAHNLEDPLSSQPAAGAADGWRCHLRPRRPSTLRTGAAFGTCFCRISRRRDRPDGSADVDQESRTPALPLTARV